MRIRTALLPVPLLFMACSWWITNRPGELVEMDLVFSHSLHSTELSIECAECHADTIDAEVLSPTHLPTEASCMGCHFREDDCNWCHQDPELVRSPPMFDTSIVAFSHSSHVSRVDDGCSTCHQDGATATELPLARPDMDTCLSCHEHAAEYQQGRCQHCHPSLQRDPPAASAAFEHDADWIRQHGPLAVSATSSCQQCHTQSSCTECHSSLSPLLPSRLSPERVELFLPHRGDFVSSHAIEARTDGQRCATCHQPSECQDCHTTWGVSALSTDPLVRHPVGWMDSTSPDFHGPEAAMRIQSCASCHDQGAASNCVDCHQVGRVGGNPHPIGWSATYDQDNARDRVACRACHIGGR